LPPTRKPNSGPDGEGGRGEGSGRGAAGRMPHWVQGATVPACPVGPIARKAGLCERLRLASATRVKRRARGGRVP
jgi:hypothetical protein